MSRWIKPEKALLMASAVILALALVPTSWLVPWTADVGSIISVPLTPLRHVASNAVAWIRPEHDGDTPSAETFGQLLEERDAFRGRWHAARLEIEKLERELAQLQAARLSGRGGDWVPRIAQVVRHNPGRLGGLLSLNMGSRQGVTPGTVAVVDGDRLVGRIASGVSGLSSTLVPLGVGGDVTGIDLHARIMHPDTEDPVLGAAAGVMIRLEPLSGTDELAGVLERRSGVAVGDVVRVGADPAWRPTAWGMLIGSVDRIEELPEQPLRQLIVIRRAVRADRLSSVTLKIEKDLAEDEALTAAVGEEEAK